MQVKKSAVSLDFPPISSTWISANAGSGKTTALVNRVVKLLLLGVPPERISCITYTKAAASEMHRRVVTRLRDLLLASDADCKILATTFLERAPSTKELTRARQLFGQMLDSSAGGIELTTIHGFCQRILRAFPLEAGVAPYFSVLDESESNLLIARASQRLLGDDGDVALVRAIELLAERAPEQKFQSLAKDILTRKTQWEMMLRAQPSDLFCARLYALHGLTMDTSNDTLVAAYCDVVSVEDAAIIRAALPKLAAHKNQQEKKIASKLSAWLAADHTLRVTMLPEMLEIWLTKSDYAPRKKLVNEQDFPVGTPIRNVFDRLVAASQCFVEQRGALAMAEESYAVSVIARALLDQYGKLKAERCALDYDGLIAKTSELLTTREMTAWVMTKLDHRIDHLLIDEAQDTSSGQWHIAQALISELVASSEGLGSAGIPRSLFVVGDEKQSIFSFQGAAPELFARKQSLFSELLAHSGAPLAPDSLTTSYRSARAILNVVDAVAALPDVASSLSAAGTSALHILSRNDAAGEVTLYPPIEAEEKAEIMPFVIPVDYQIIRSSAQKLTEEIADKISGWVDKRSLANENRMVAAGDILILVRNRRPMVPCLIRALERCSIPVAGIDRLILSDHLAVKDLLALMRWVSFYGDDLALAQVLRSPLIGISEDELCRLAYGREGSLWERVLGSAQVSNSPPEGESNRPCDSVGGNSTAYPPTDLQEQIPLPLKGGAKLRSWLSNKSASPYDFLTKVLEVDGARHRFAERFSEEVHEVLDELKEQAMHLPQTMAPMLANFESFVTASERIIKREQEGQTANHVRIMTVHGAKGLEAPIVILADTAGVPDTAREQSYTVTDGKGQNFPVVRFSEISAFAPIFGQVKTEKKAALFAEYHRLLYVAMTRAKDELHVFASEKRGKIPERSWYALIEKALRGLPVTQNEDGSITLRDALVSKKRESASLSKRPALPLPPWAHAPLPRRATPRVFTPSKLGTGTPIPFSRFAPEAAKERGIRIHRLLQFLKKDTSEPELHALLAVIAPDWDDKTRTAIGAEIWKLYCQEHWLWEGEAHAEVSISGDIDIAGVLSPVNGQIDRLLRSKDGLLVLDYKTGRHVPTSTTEVPRNYLLQLKTYVALLQRMEPDTPIRCAILWTYRPFLMELTAAVAEVSWEE